MRPIHRLSVSLLAATLVACGAPAPLPEVPAGAPEDFPLDRYADSTGQSPVYRVDTAGSLLRVYAYRGGALKRLGHDHVIASRDVTGFVRRSGQAGRYRFEADLYLPLAAMTVDEPELRADAGFDTEPSDEDRAGTRSNMLKSLEAGNYPFVSAALRGEPVDAAALDRGETLTVDANVDFTMHGVTRSMTVPVTLRQEGPALSASGRFEIAQSDFDIEPFSVLGGALAVRDQLEVQFDIVAVRLR